jgi:hypothetical protein
MAETARVFAPWAEGALLGSALAGAVALPRLGGGPGAWLTAAGFAALALGPAVGALRAARPLSRAGLGVPLGALVALPVLSVLARVLKATTHHRPLGAATFAVIAAAVLLGAMALTSRLLIAGSVVPQSGGSRLARVALAALVLVSLGIGALLLLPALSSEAARAGVRAPYVEAALLLTGGAAAGLVNLPPGLGRLARLGGPLAWLILVAGAVVTASM